VYCTLKLGELNPDKSETTQHTGLGAAQWNESYFVDCPRLDNGHKDLTLLGGFFFFF
jgi:hypothetical protein